MTDHPEGTPTPMRGAPLLPPRPEIAGQWLEKSGHRWKLLVGDCLFFSPTFCLLSFIAASRFARGEEHAWIRDLSINALLFSLPCAAVGVALHQLIRCRVCGLHLPSSVGARVAGAGRWAWVKSLGVCPGCGDDGSASEESRSRWQRNGRRPEEPYWSTARILVAILSVIIGLVGATYLMDFTASRAFPKPKPPASGALPK